MNKQMCSGAKEHPHSEAKLEVYITVVGGRNNIFKLLPIKYVNCHKVALCMSMLASFGSGNFYNLVSKTPPKQTAHELKR